MSTEEKAAEQTGRQAEGQRETGPPNTTGNVGDRGRSPGENTRQVTFAEPRWTGPGYECWTCGNKPQTCVLASTTGKRVDKCVNNK